MKNLALLFFAALTFAACTGGSGSNSTEDQAKDPPKPVVDPVKPPNHIMSIKDRFQYINDHKVDYKEVVREYEPDPVGGKFIAWMDGEAYARLREEMYDDHGPMYNEYYFENGRCVFVFEHSELDEMGTGATHVTEDRYYLKDGVMLLHYNKRKKFSKAEARDMSQVRNEEVLVNGAQDGEEKEYEVNDAIKRFEKLADGE